jgi:hypothetical protein
MMRHTAVAVSALFVLACAGAPNAQGEGSGPRQHVEIRFDDMALHPETAILRQGGNAVWINTSTEFQGAVVFPESIKASFTCDDLRPIFSKTGTGYQSIPITGDVENVTLPCPLKPGSYDYQLYLFDDMSGMDNPQRTLQGKIVVE